MKEPNHPQGFRTGSIHCGIRPNTTKHDLALVVSEVPCAAAAVYTTNRVKAAPLYVTRAHLTDGTAQAVIINSGNANACCPKGMENARKMAELAAQKLGLQPESVLVASTGIIGQDLDMEVVQAGTEQIVLGMDWQSTRKAILTTDTVEKAAFASADMDGTEVGLYGFAKGSGMIHPNMGTMLCFILTDAKISSADLQAMLQKEVRCTFNRVSVDGDTSTNDMCMVLANGLARNGTSQQALAHFQAALHEVMESLAKQIAGDGEGATRLLTVTVEGAQSEEQAEVLAMAVVSSSLVKAAMFGADANWGRVLCAMGYSGMAFDPEKTDIAFCSKAGTIQVCRNGQGLPFDEGLAKKILSEPDVTILCDIHEGDALVSCWGCDLTYDYVKINGDYRT